VNGIELLLDETIPFGAEKGKIVESRVGRGFGNGVRGEVWVDGGEDAVGFGELEKGIVEVDLNLGEVEGIIAELYGLAAEVSRDTVAIAAEREGGRLGDLAGGAVEKSLAEVSRVDGAGGG
jgi:hypothetical protein